MASRIPEATIEEIKARTDIGELISSYGIQLRHAGSSLKACCPFHREKTPSFHVNVARGFYHCFGCGEKGNAITFVEKYEGLTFVEAVKRLAQRCGVEIKETEDPNAGRRKRLYALMENVAQFYRRCLLKMKDAQIARDYLAKRELDEKTQEDFLVGFAPQGASAMMKWAEKNGYTLEEMEEAGILKGPRSAGDKPYHRFSGRLMFTIRDRQGRVVAFSGRQLVENKNSGKYVNSPETGIFRKSNVLYAFDKAAANIAKSPHREVIICEGQIDCIRLHISGFPVAVAAQGTAFTSEHVKMLSRVADAAALAYDDDAAGHKATVRAAAMLLAAGIPARVVRIPGGNDPDSFLREHGADAFARLLDEAESVVSFQCRTERAKEEHPDSLGAVSRVTRAVLQTIAACSNAVLKASMAAEAAKLLQLPIEAVNEELAKTKPDAKLAPRAAAPSPDAGDEPNIADSDFIDDDSLPDEGVAAATYAPPPPEEISLLAFLLDNEEDGALIEEAKNLLPVQIFCHEYTRKCAEGFFAPGGSRVASALVTETVDERRIAVQVLAKAGVVQPSAVSPLETLHSLVKAIWLSFLNRACDSTTIDKSNSAANAGHNRLVSAQMVFAHCDWAAQAACIEDFKKGQNQWT